MSPLLFPLLVALAFGQASSQLQCKEGYVQFQDSCYSLTGASDDTWANAEQQCKFSGGHLVSISNKEENEFVKSLFEKTDNKVVWIGGQRVEPQRHLSWRWVDGANMEYDNWGAGQPRNFREKNSMMMFKDGTWGNEDGTLRYAFICKESQRPTCDDDYYLYGSQCYAFKEAKLGFGAAQKNCSADGGNLASVHSEELNVFLQKLTENTMAWIGGRKDDEAALTWQWNDQTPFDYQDWARKQPAASPQNLCILMNYHPYGQDSWGWANELCDIAYGYVCQKQRIVAALA
ncbi:macrophage mannose receptor 1-like [Engraulis encrasicolus]|uniref:macrophage mannose receptor 1-like n=1 Tax=Engraulis encrasicolus TaxID=184585 RepID=UPI002FD2380A